MGSDPRVETWADPAATDDLRDIVRVLEKLTPDRSAARRAAEGGAAVDRALWDKLAKLGLLCGVLPEGLGGADAGLATEAAVAEALAGKVAPIPLISVFLATHIFAAGEGEAAQALARTLASGACIVGAALSAERGVDVGLSLVEAGSNHRISGVIPDVMDGAALDIVLVPVAGRWWAIDTGADGVERLELSGLDPTRRMASLSLRDAACVAVSSADPEAILSVAWTLLAAEAVGVARAALDLTSRYCLDRRQFGEQIGRFQAIKHKLADALVDVENARSALEGALRSVRDDFPDPRASRVAKIVATSAAARVVSEAVQIHGAIGNTWDHDLHLLLRRAKSVQLMLGSGDRHLDVLGAELTQPSEAGLRRAPEGPGSELSLDERDRDFIEELRDWLDAHATGERLGELRSRAIPALREWQATMADAGWAGIHWPLEYGGRSASFLQQVLYHSELARRGLPPLVGNRGLSLVGPTLIAHGAPEQRDRFLAASRRADILWASGLSEPGAGSDLASLQTRAVVDGDTLVVTGQKTWTSGAHYSEWMYTLVRTGASIPKHAGISCVLIPLAAPGVTVCPIRRMNGEAGFNEVFLDEVRIPTGNMVGELDQGWKVAKTSLAHEHSTVFLGAQFRQSLLVERTIAQLGRREAAYGVDHGLRRRAAQAWINTQLLRLHGLRNMVRILDSGQPGAEGSVLKLFGQEEEKRLYELALDVHGVEGLTAGRPGKAYLGSRAATVGGGTSEIHRNKIAERVLGMPRDPWADDWA